MAVTVNNGTQTPVVGAETTIATIAGGPFDEVSVYFIGGTGGAGGAIGVNLYATVAGATSRIASAQVMGGSVGTLVEFADTGSGATGTTSQTQNQNTSFLVDAGATTYIVKIVDLSTTPIPPGGSARASCTVTLAGVNSSDTAVDTPVVGAFAGLAAGATGSCAAQPGYNVQMDVAVSQAFTTPATVTVTADCGPGSVSAIVKQQQYTGSGGAGLFAIFRNLHLPVATEYIVSLTNNGTAAATFAVTSMTYTGAAAGGGGGGAIALVGNTNGLSNNNTNEDFVTLSVDANVNIAALAHPSGSLTIGMSGLTADRTVFLNTTATGSVGDTTIVKDVDGSLTLHNIIVDAGAGNTIDGAQTYTITAVQNGVKGAITAKRLSATAWAIV